MIAAVLFRHENHAATRRPLDGERRLIQHCPLVDTEAVPDAVPSTLAAKNYRLGRVSAALPAGVPPHLATLARQTSGGAPVPRLIIICIRK